MGIGEIVSVLMLFALGTLFLTATSCDDTQMMKLVINNVVRFPERNQGFNTHVVRFRTHAAMYLSVLCR